VSAESFSLQVESGSGSGVDFLFSFHDETIFNELSDEYSGVGLSDLFDFIGINPDSLLSALEDFGGNTFLAFQTDHKLSDYLMLIINWEFIFLIMHTLSCKFLAKLITYN
jgi:hypothetical protein